ncbi:MAG: bifunctional folylpolyglutamate synthase/dihydrofolate synthase [Clostridia bacterium]|nr:bifunctional folylpolyglutamate synthase/dihydrofolate synthase [Clostridia bacterium]
MTIEETMAYIHATAWQGSRPGLSRITALLSALGNPEADLRCIHIAGTNGKGSTSAMLDAILRAAGYRTALFTSPYLYAFGERMQIDGVPIPDDALCRVIDRIRPAVDAMEDRPTEFELITAAAFVYFADEGVDVAVIEVGMGGRLDATNVLEAPLLSVITGIALDHTAYLGDTVEAIAREKAGILRPGTLAVSGALDEGVRRVLREEAAERGTEIAFTDLRELRDVRPTRFGSDFSYRGRKGLHIPFAASYQPKNAALVLDACDALVARGLRLTEEAIARGLRKVAWPGRFEYLSHDPDVVFDGSHNPEGIEAALRSIEALYEGKFLLLTGVMGDKDYGAMIDTLSPRVARAFCVRPDNPRALPADELAAAWQASGVTASGYPTVPAAMQAAVTAAKAEDLPLFILGSLYLYREAKDAFLAVQ